MVPLIVSFSLYLLALRVPKTISISMSVALENGDNPIKHSLLPSGLEPGTKEPFTSIHSEPPQTLLLCDC